MESHIPEFLQSCRRPRHFRTDQWYHDPTGAGISYEPTGRESEALRAQKAKRRLELWWHKEPDANYRTALSVGKFEDAKKQRFTADGKTESRSVTGCFESDVAHPLNS